MMFLVKLGHIRPESSAGIFTASDEHGVNRIGRDKINAIGVSREGLNGLTRECVNSL